MYQNALKFFRKTQKSKNRVEYHVLAAVVETLMLSFYCAICFPFFFTYDIFSWGRGAVGAAAGMELYVTLARLSKFFGFLRFSSPRAVKTPPGGPKLFIVYKFKP